MATKKSIKIIIQPTREDLAERVNSVPHSKIRIINSITSVNNNLFSFLCGIITNIPISVLFNILTIKLSFSWIGFIVLSLYVLFLFASSMLAVCAIKFTVKHIEINYFCNRISNKEIYINCLIEKILDNMAELSSIVCHTFICAGASLILIISLFIVNNFV